MAKQSSSSGKIASPPLDVDEVMKALASPQRREILAWLKDPKAEFSDQEHPLSMGVCAGKIHERSGLSQSTVSAHLACLQRAGLVSARKVGQWIFYSRNEPVVAAFLRQMQREL